MTDPDLILDFADRCFREALEDADNLRTVLRRTLGPQADSFDFSQRRMLPRNFLLPNWQGRESAISCAKFRSVYRGTGAGHLSAF